MSPERSGLDRDQPDASKSHDDGERSLTARLDLS
jgi:hypothetical protein